MGNTEFVMREDEPVEAGMNPFEADAFHMGTPGPDDVTMMYARFNCNKYVIIHHIPTGRRIRVTLPWLDCDHEVH